MVREREGTEGGNLRWKGEVPAVFRPRKKDSKKSEEEERMKRNSMTINIKLSDRAFKPTRGHATDAGMDLYTPDMLIVKPGRAVTVDTGVHVEIPQGHCGYVKGRSSLNFKRSIVVPDGTIDCGFTGSIQVRLYNLGDHPVIINPGERIAQLVLHPIITPLLDVVDELEDTERGDGGFGSTGK
jgi:dUTP pyrophosphatase